MFNMASSKSNKVNPDRSSNTTDISSDNPNDIMIHDLNIYYSGKKAIDGVSIRIREKKVTAFIGPSGCGKSTLLRNINRMNEEIMGCTFDGRIIWNGQNILDKRVDPVSLRRRIGMVFQKPNPFPKSIFDNIAYGPRLMGVKNKKKLAQIVEKSLRDSALWDEVKDRLKESAMGLSGGQQQRLCIARALAVEPDVILMDEPCSALDPIATAKIEDLINELKKSTR